MSELKKPNREQWTCGMCNMQTHGEWDAESRPKGSEDEDEWLPLCQVCTIEVKKGFIADEDLEDEGTYSP